MVSELIGYVQRGLKFQWDIILGQIAPSDSSVIDNWIQKYLTNKDEFFRELYKWSRGTYQILIPRKNNNLEIAEVSRVNIQFSKDIEKLKISVFPRIIINDRLLSPIYTTKDIEFMIVDGSI